MHGYVVNPRKNLAVFLILQRQRRAGNPIFDVLRMSNIILTFYTLFLFRVQLPHQL
jgi:hypothetical protein